MSCRDLKERVPGAYEWLIRKEPDWIHARLIHEFDKPRWNEWGEAALAELKAAYAEIQSSGDKRKRVTISWLARAAGRNGSGGGIQKSPLKRKKQEERNSLMMM